MRRIGKISLAAVAALVGTAGAGLAQADGVYRFNDQGTRGRGQVGFNYGYLGDDATLAAVPEGYSHYRLDDISMRFALVDYDSTTTPDRPGGTSNPYNPYDTTGISAFTPTIEMSVFAIDPITRRPIGAALGTAVVSDRTFQPANIQFDEPNFDPELFTDDDVQEVTFDFGGQDVVLPEHFAFAYRVTGGVAADDVTDPANEDINDEMNFFVSIFTTEEVSDPTPVGSTVYGSLLYGNGTPGFPAGWVFNDLPAGADNNPGADWSVGSNLPATINATLVVPEPASLGLLALGGLAMLKRRRMA